MRREMIALVLPGLAALAAVLILQPRAWYAWIGILVIGAMGVRSIHHIARKP